MSAQYEAAKAEVEKLTHSEQLRLIAYMQESHSENLAQGPGLRIEDFMGVATYPQCGEDAQEWISRERRLSDEHRQLR